MAGSQRRDPLVLAILTALAAAGCCSAEVREQCFPVEEPVCPSQEEAAELITAEEITSDGVYYPARTYIDGTVRHELPAECCYETVVERCFEMNGFGRPYVRRGKTVFARPLAAPDTGRSRARALLQEPLRTRLAAIWVRRGALEHAAAASFGRFALDLRALGAPEPLVREAIRAIRDEARHARMAFELARSFGDPGHRPGALAVDPSPCADLPTFVRRTVADGCVEETAGVAILEARAAAAIDRRTRACLRLLAREEARHARLGFRALAWALAGGGPEVRRAAVASLEEALSAHDRDLRPASAEPEGIAFGELGPAALSEVARRALRERVRPRMAALGLEVACAA